MDENEKGKCSMQNNMDECRRNMLPVLDALVVLSGNGRCPLLLHCHMAIHALRR